MASTEESFQRSISKIASNVACEKYEQTYHEEFLFSEECVTYETYLHLEAYTKSIGLSNRNNRLVFGYKVKKFFTGDKKTLYDHVSVVNIDINDATDPWQESAFCYSYGIRPCYQYTSRDPFIDERPRWGI